ncbi:hypothetical protein BOTBODRAFT_146867 [Botryobasidium botryosum FD-172 SS1]|uniref:F-box domain-containing protein n=1 Tax=Botryobasidium botryosum (strain FD-172 SS1) TaxID=930990 RepID=A0A067M8P7_BOTB1|nr:hypothetical protein BOTBODRAFT_146867 [Botryobasidium botryosum FD-172 SS1]
MPHHQNRHLTPRTSHAKTTAKNFPTFQPAHHGNEITCMPSEIITHFTSFLSPHDLLALSLVSKSFRDHVRREDTWKAAFYLNFLAIGPEESEHGRALQLRRTEDTWCKEYVFRHNLARRWAKSRNPTISHSPHHSNISSMLLLPDQKSLLTSSLAYGVVSRSYPFTGKVLKGFLDASGLLNGQGIGNPNAEFAPDVTAIALQSWGSTTVNIVWGFRTGSVAVATASRVMELGKGGVVLMSRARIEDTHLGQVEDIYFQDSGGYKPPTATVRGRPVFASAGADGKIKLWEAKRMQLRCVWTGNTSKENVLPPDACLKVVFDSGSGTVVGALRSGDIVVYAGLDIASVQNEEGERSFHLAHSHFVRIPALEGSEQPIPTSGLPATEPSTRALAVLQLQADPYDSRHITLLVHHEGDYSFSRVDIRFPTTPTDAVRYTRTLFEDGRHGAFTAFKANFVARSALKIGAVSEASTPLTPNSTAPFGSSSTLFPTTYTTAPTPRKIETSYILTGDAAGWVRVFSWDAASSSSHDEANEKETVVVSKMKWEAHDDGAITAINASDFVIVTGSACGGIKIWDVLTHALIRAFGTASPRGHVHPGPAAPGDAGNTGNAREGVNEIIVKRDFVMAAVGGRALAWKIGPLGVGGKGKEKKRSGGSGRDMSKWHQQIQIKNDIRESRIEIEQERRAVQRSYAREHAQMATLGELGLDEGEALEYALMLSREEEEARVGDDSMTWFTPPPSASASSSGFSSSQPSSPGFGRGDEDADVDARGMTPDSYSPTPIPSPRTRGDPIRSASASDSQNPAFPPISPSPRKSVPQSPKSGSWSSIVQSLMPSSSSTPARSAAERAVDNPSSSGSPPWTASSAAAMAPSGGSSLLAASLARHNVSATSSSASLSQGRRRGARDEDEELQFVLALSLAEARSRGEDV